MMKRLVWILFGYYENINDFKSLTLSKESFKFLNYCVYLWKGIIIRYVTEKIKIFVVIMGMKILVKWKV